MSYPAAYRKPRPSTGGTVWRRPPRSGVGGNNVLHFPRRLPRGTFGAPTPIPGRPHFGLPVRPVAPPGGGYTLPRLPLGRILGIFGAALTIDQYWRSFENTGMVGPLVSPALFGFTHVCGPQGWPGPPYTFEQKRIFGNSMLGTPTCGLGLQATSVNPPTTDLRPVPNTRRILDYYVHDTLLNRGFVFDQWSRTATSPVPALRYAMPISPFRLMPTANAWLGGWSPTINVVDVAPTPLALSNLFNGEPPFPEGPIRGYTPPNNSGRRFPENGLVDAIQEGIRLGVVVRPNVQDVRTEPRERERKMELGSAVGRAAISAFRGLQTWGQTNAAIDALWRAIPTRYRPAGKRTWWQKYADVYENFQHVDLAEAARNAAGVAANIRVWGALFGAAQRGAETQAGVNQGWSLTRGLNNYSRTAQDNPRFGTKRANGAFNGYYYSRAVRNEFGRRIGSTRRWHSASDARRERAYSGRAGPTRRRQQARLASRRRKFRSWR